MSNGQFAFMNVKDFKLMFILINKTNIKDISQIKYPMLTLMQIKVFFLNVQV
jgi:hypothetical protein